MATPPQSGYRCKFVDNVKDYECPVCLHVTREPNLTSCCEQHFCHYCIQTKLSNNKPCPCCKENSFTVFLDKKQNRRVLDLKVYCDNKGLCDWVGGLGELDQHLTEKCQYVFVACSYNCENTTMRLHIEDHERPHSCEYCQLKGTYQDIQEDHVPVCPKYPLICPNKCGGPVEREQLEQHLKECPLAMVECELREVGCEEMVQRKDMDRHMEEAAQKHLKLSTSYFLKNKKIQAKEMSTLKQELNELRFDYGQQFEEHERATTSLKNEIYSLRTVFDKYSHKQSTAASIVNLSVDYRSLELSDTKRWVNPRHFTTISGYTMTINLRIRSNCLEIQLTHIESAMDDSLKWPKVFSMKVRLVNQDDDFDYYEEIANNLRVQRRKNKQLNIAQAIIETHGQYEDSVKYMYIDDNDNIKLEIVVFET